MICDSFNQPGYEQSSCSHYISRNSCCFLPSLWFLAVAAPRRSVAGAPTSPSHINRQNNTVGSGLGGASGGGGRSWGTERLVAISSMLDEVNCDVRSPPLKVTKNDKLYARTSHWPLLKPPGTVIIPAPTVLAGYCAAQTVLRLAGPWMEADKAGVGEYNWENRN